MSVNRESIANWISTHFGSEALLFNLKLTYPEIMVGGEKKKNYSTYSQVKLHFDKAKRIAEDAKWGMSEEVAKIGDSFEDNAQSRYDVFLGYMRAALSAVAFNVSLAPRKRNERNVLIALNNTIAGILPYQFGDDYSGSLVLTAPDMTGKVQKKDRAAFQEKLQKYQEHVKKLCKAAQSLWQQKLTFTYAGRNEKIREGLDSEDGYLSETTTKDKIQMRHMTGDEKARFLGGLMRIFGVGQAEGITPVETSVEIATGEVEEDRRTSQGETVFEAERKKATLAEVLIAVARNGANILITAHKMDNCNTMGAFNGNFDGYRDYTAISFREDLLADPLKDWEDYYTYYDPNNDYSQNLWWTFSHELQHIYPIYDNEYKGLPDDEPVTYTRETRYSDRTITTTTTVNPPSEEGEYTGFQIRESPEEDVPSFVDEQALKLNKKKEWRGKFADVDIEPSFTAYDLTDPAQIKWLRGWFEGRLDTLTTNVDTFSALSIDKTETVLKGMLDELQSLKKLAPNLALDNDSYDPQKVAKVKVAELIEVGLNLKESEFHTYILDNKKGYFPQWNVWLSIAKCFNLESHFKESARAMMQDVVDGRKRDYVSSEFAKEKINIKVWEQEFGIKLTY
jgi:hypothetical protein